MTVLEPAAAYRLWSESYDAEANPLLALEERLLKPRLKLAPGMRVLDLATGTGRWLDYALAAGANAFGIDSSNEMLARAASKGMAGRVVQGTLTPLPFSNEFAGVAICSFALGYVDSVEPAFREMARTARQVIVSDLHPDGIRAGWVRSFRCGDTSYEVASRAHSIESLDAAAQSAGLKLKWRVEAGFEEPERWAFERAGRSSKFEAARSVRAILISCWERA